MVGGGQGLGVPDQTRGSQDSPTPSADAATGAGPGASAHLTQPCPLGHGTVEFVPEPGAGLRSGWALALPFFVPRHPVSQQVLLTLTHALYQAA